MKVKKFMAPTMQDAMKKIRMELGQDAVILNSKVVHIGGFMGMFSKKRIEVIAAADQDETSNISAKSKIPIHTPTINTMKAEWETKPETNESFSKEIAELKTMIKDLKGQDQNLILPEPVKKVNEILHNQEIHAALRGKLITKLMENWYTGSKLSSSEIFSLTHDFLKNELEGIPFGPAPINKKFIYVTGPTGVGKTTTLAKLAADYMLKNNKKVAFITTDTYRIAAIEQLKTYAGILDVPIEVCYTMEDFQKAKEQFESLDTVFVDTAGRNFRNAQYVHDLKEVMDFKEDAETYLVLSATAKLQDMKEIYEQFQLIPIKQAIFTKLDETSVTGTIFEFIQFTKLGAAYFTTGQNVPDDMEAASKENLIERILREEK